MHTLCLVESVDALLPLYDCLTAPPPAKYYVLFFQVSVIMHCFLHCLKMIIHNIQVQYSFIV